MLNWISALPISFRAAAVAFAGIVALGIALVWIVFGNVDGAMREMAINRQESNMAVAWEVLLHQGTEFKIVEGNLYAGSYRVNNNFDVVDRAQKIIGGVVTVFMGDVRVSTNVLRPDGSRAISFIPSFFRCPAAQKPLQP